MSHTPGPWMTEHNVPTAAIPGHIVKAAKPPYRPICLVPEGGGGDSTEAQRCNAALIEQAPARAMLVKALWLKVARLEPTTREIACDGIRASVQLDRDGTPIIGDHLFNMLAKAVTKATTPQGPTAP